MSRGLLELLVKDAPIISDFADGIKFRGMAREELLLLNGRKFKVLQKELNGKNWDILLQQI